MHGAVLTEALASRFGVHIEVTTDFALARSLGVPCPAVTAAAIFYWALAIGIPIAISLIAIAFFRARSSGWPRGAGTA